MLTVAQTLRQLPGAAVALRRCLETAISDGFADYPCVKYRGTFNATAPNSNAMRAIPEGYERVKDYRGTKGIDKKFICFIVVKRER